MNSTPKQQEELELADRLLAKLGYTNAVLVADDRPDVLAQINGKKIGIEVTVFHADEHKSAKGSDLRPAEKLLANQSPNQTYAMWGESNPNPSLIKRIEDKIQKSSAYDASHCEQLWLLVSTGIPNPGSLVSTLAVPAFIEVTELNRLTHQALCNSPYAVAYIHMLLPSALYSWSRNSQWQKIS